MEFVQGGVVVIHLAEIVLRYSDGVCLEGNSLAHLGTNPEIGIGAKGAFLRIVSFMSFYNAKDALLNKVRVGHLASFGV